MLRGNECVDDCGDGYINRYTNNFCEPCKVGCTTCEIEPDNCLSCDTSSATPSFFKNSCLEECPIEFSIPSLDGLMCDACEAKCKTCAGRTDICTSCPDFLRFDQTKLDCF